MPDGCARELSVFRKKRWEFRDGWFLKHFRERALEYVKAKYYRCVFNEVPIYIINGRTLHIAGQPR